jgi:hypothetical protein
MKKLKEDGLSDEEHDAFLRLCAAEGKDESDKVNWSNNEKSTIEKNPGKLAPSTGALLSSLVLLAKNASILNFIVATSAGTLWLEP